MKFVLDQGLPRSTVNYLATLGIFAEHTGDIGMARASDAAILAYALALAQQAVVVTLDADFHQLLAASKAIAPSVVRIRIEGLKDMQLATILTQVIGAAGADLASGAAVSVTRSRIRVRSLPIGH